MRKVGVLYKINIKKKKIYESLVKIWECENGGNKNQGVLLTVLLQNCATLWYGTQGISLKINHFKDKSL